MAKKKRLEKGYYEPVRRFLQSEMDCVTQSVNKDGSPRVFVGRGVEGLIVDVFGIRGVRETNSRTLEGIAIEVKRSKRTPSLRNLVQASQYSRLAHRRYLAQPGQFGKKTVREASALGIGLIQISARGMRILAESRLFNPDQETFESFLQRSLKIVRCALCRCHLHRYKKGDHHINANGHWVLDEISPPPAHGVFNKKMYLCPKCEEIVTGIADADALRKSVDKLKKQVFNIQQRLRKA